MRRALAHRAIRLRPRLARKPDCGRVQGGQPVLPHHMRPVGVFSLGRDALWWMTQHATCNPSCDVWLPEYCCPQAIDVFQRAGWTLQPYALREDFTVDWELFAESALGTGRGLLVLVDLLGYPCVVPEELRGDIRRSFRSVLRDCAQGLPTANLSIETGQEEGLALFSLRKPFPIPDFAILCSEDDPTLASDSRGVGHAPGSRATSLRRSAFAQFESQLLRRPSISCIPGVQSVRRWLKRSSVLGQRPSTLSWRLSTGLDVQSAASARREHAAMLLEGLEGIALYKEVPVAAAPYYFPILVEEPARAMRRLRKHGVQCTALWGGEGLWSNWSSVSVKASVERLLCLPVHQELSLEDVSRLRALLHGVAS